MCPPKFPSPSLGVPCSDGRCGEKVSGSLKADFKPNGRNDIGTQSIIIEGHENGSRAYDRSLCPEGTGLETHIKAHHISADFSRHNPLLCRNCLIRELSYCGVICD